MGLALGGVGEIAEDGDGGRRLVEVGLGEWRGLAVEGPIPDPARLIVACRAGLEPLTAQAGAQVRDLSAFESAPFAVVAGDRNLRRRSRVRKRQPRE